MFSTYETALAETGKLFRRIDFSLDELKYQYPADPVFEELETPPCLLAGSAGEIDPKSASAAAFPMGRRKRCWMPSAMKPRSSASWIMLLTF